jgi:hypothetical protein
MRTLYRGDVAIVALGPEIVRCVVRQFEGERVKVQIGADWTWIFTEELRWDGLCLGGRLPRTEWGWRRLGRKVTANL